MQIIQVYSFHESYINKIFQAKGSVIVKDSVIAFRGFLNSLNDEDYLFNLIAYTIAPTIKGLKPATTVTLCSNDRNLCENWKIYKDVIINSLRLKAFELKETGKAIVILFYNEKALKSKLLNESTIEFLSNFGYSKCSTLQDNLNVLKERFSNSLFPHELGVFLGFPLLDVKAFIESPRNEYLTCGYWKVYHNKDSALKTFKGYDEAKYEIASLLFKTKDHFILNPYAALESI
jgi:hypothetical protein